MPKFRFPLAKNIPTDSDYKEICPDAGARPSCQLKVTAQSGAYPPSDSHGNLTVVNLPLEPAGNGCETLIEVFMQTGCPPDTIDMTWDSDLSPSTITPNTSEYIYVKDGYGNFAWEIVGGYGFALEDTETTGLRNTLIADSTACGTARIKVVDMCQTEIIGEVNGGASSLAWDDINSGQTVARNSSVTVCVTGGNLPFTWDVSGVGFSLHSVETYGQQNTVYADSTACGVATITVEDLCGTQTTGTVRCTHGVWTEIDLTSQKHTCFTTGQGTCIDTTHIQLIQNEYKVWENIDWACMNLNSTCPPVNCAGAANYYFDPTVWGGSCLLSGCIQTTLTCACWCPNVGGTGCFNWGTGSVGDCCVSGSMVPRLGVKERRAWIWECV